jgi:mannose-1-phosphate guanylyltransferase
LGTWKSVHENLQGDELNTTLNVNLHAVDAANNLIVSEKEKLVVIKGLDGYFIVDTKDALLICKKDQEQEVKKLVGDIRKRYNGKYN